MLGALEPHAPGLLAKLGLDSMNPKLDARHPEVVRERMMNFCRKLANHLVALSDLPNRDRVPSILRRLRIFNQAKRNDIGAVTGILYVSKRLDNRITENLSCH